MTATLIEPETRKHQLHEVLLGYLQDPHVTVWPGGDGLTVEEVLHGYLQAAAAGEVPGRPELLARHPELRAELEAFFDEEEFLIPRPRS